MHRNVFVGWANSMP